MARGNSTNFTGPLQFPFATAGTDIFRKEDVQTLAQAVDQHDHSTGKGLALSAGSIPAGSITSAMIADGTIQATDIANGAITTTQIADGTIATADLANAAVTNAKLASDVGRANLLTNGGFEIWQRGAGPYTGTSSGSICADRWGGLTTGSDTVSTSKDTTNMDSASGSLACAAMTFTLSGGGGQSGLTQTLKPSDGYQLPNATLSLSVRVRTSITNAARLAVYNGSAWIYGTYHPGDGAYHTLTLTWTCAPATTTINVGVGFSASCTAYIDNAMLVVGAQPCDYVPMHPADDLARGLRYCQRWQPNSTSSLLASAYAWSATNGYAFVPQLAEMAVSPTLTVSAPSHWSVATGAGSAQACTALSAGAVNSPTGPLVLGCTVASGITAGQAGTFGPNTTAAWLMLEANP